VKEKAKTNKLQNNMNWKDIKGLIREELNEETNVTADNTTFIMLMGVNKNPTKLGLKIQFTPKGNALDNETKAKLRTLLQSKLNDGLREHKLQVSIDTDVPNPNVIGFMIDLASIKDMVVRSIGGSKSTPEPEVPSEPEIGDEF